MPNPNRVIDKSHLSIEQAIERGVLHRDHDAHVYRWTHVAKLMHEHSRYKTARILDVGCGKDVPLACMLHSNRLIVEQYVGIDYNRGFKDRNFGRMPVALYGGKIFPRCMKLGENSYRIDGTEQRFRYPNVITSFEVLEHVKPGHMVKMLRAMHKMAVRGKAEVIISTPCWNVKNTAENHINEVKHAALGSVLENVGFSVDHNFGTFANIYDYKDELFKTFPGTEKFFEAQREYYDTNILSNMFAASFPHLSRNSLWRLTPAKPGYVRKFGPLSSVPEPWTSSDDWQDLNTSIADEAQENEE